MEMIVTITFKLSGYDKYFDRGHYKIKIHQES